ncbi:E9 [Pygoscelis adeliae papillomavirus 1]|uniref:E9 n=1 Tax=Pygoscelis adeliae papillomavirus 1 TaxID=1480065 RepID=X2JSD9_9PAPI|nr:E9 [Pygoscelis adeliae papillomavirus 1]AHN65800.1 E9 [Pygoscelis adeliae papillomavirus 1]
MPTIYYPNWETVYLIRDPENLPMDGMTSVTLRTNSDQQSWRCCNLALPIFLKRAGDGLRLRCIDQHLPTLTRRITGTADRIPTQDTRLDVLVDLGWRTEYLLRTRLPWNTCTVITPTENLCSLYQLLGPSTQEAAERRRDLMVALLELNTERRQRHLRRGRMRGMSYYNAY